MRIEIPGDEWIAARALLSFADVDEREVTGMLRLVARAGRRQWWASDTRQLAVEDGGGDDQEYEVLVSPRLVAFAIAHDEMVEDVVLEIIHDEQGVPEQVSCRCGGAVLSVSPDLRAFPPVDDVWSDLAGQHGDDQPRATFDSGDVATLVQQASQRALPQDDEREDDAPLLWSGLDEGVISFQMGWAGLGQTTFELRGEGRGAASMAIPPMQLSAAARWLRPTTTVVMPEEVGPLLLSDGSRSVVIMPLDTAAPAWRRTESVMAQVFGEEVLDRDDDGDYPLTVAGTEVYGRFVPGDVSVLQVFAVVLADVSPDPALLSELNDQNASLRFVRTFAVGGQVLVECDLIAGTLDPEELSEAFAGCRRTAEELGPMLSAVYGGQRPGRNVDQRWADYRNTVIEAEIVPGAKIILSGPEAEKRWPVDGPVWVLTAHDPFGRRRPDEKNAADNGRLASELVTAGGGFVRAFGRNLDGTYGEAGFFVWDIDRNVARSLGRSYGQEAVFEVDEFELRVVGCFDDRVDVQPRLATEGQYKAAGGSEPQARDV